MTDFVKKFKFFEQTQTETILQTKDHKIGKSFVKNNDKIKTFI